jgi:L-methionine (R)-S-oxide reductase
LRERLILLRFGVSWRTSLHNPGLMGCFGISISLRKILFTRLELPLIAVLCNCILMAETLYIPVGADRKSVYEAIMPQLRALTHGEVDLIANSANVVAALKEAFGFFWVGCYFIKPSLDALSEELVLGPFQGPVACTRIALGRGVCGAAWKGSQTILVPDVELFPGHIACSAISKSEIVVPIYNGAGTLVGVLDVDSDKLDDFSETDKFYLEKIVSIIGSSI